MFIKDYSNEIIKVSFNLIKNYKFKLKSEHITELNLLKKSLIFHLL